MKNKPHRRPHIFAATVLATLLLAGCASTTVDENFASAQQLTRERLGSEVAWLRTEEARRQAERDVTALLDKPLDGDGAVRIALAHSPAVQAMLYESAGASASATQAARLPNPVFTFERLVRGEAGAREIELTRALSVSVLDWLLLPSRLRLANYRQDANRLTLAANMVQAATRARQAWVSATAAEQSLHYAQQVKATADASAELARRMQAVGNFSKLQRAREHAFAADAVAQLARAAQASTSSREALVRALGLNEPQAAALTLPDHLPALPAQPKSGPDVAQAAVSQRLDVRMAQANLAFVAKEQGLTRIASFVNDIDLGVIHKSETGLPAQKGYEASVPLPIFDFGDAVRAQAEAAYMAALQRAAQLSVDAQSQVREAYGAYRTRYDLARHYRDEVVPLRKTIAEENLLRYNGMLIGVFELLADAREQIASVIQAIDAQRDFWLADAALQATLIGQPVPSAAMAVEPRALSGPNAAGH
jgi:outer membrane protein TolC